MEFFCHIYLKWFWMAWDVFRMFGNCVRCIQSVSDVRRIFIKLKENSEAFSPQENLSSCKVCLFNRVVGPYSSRIVKFTKHIKNEDLLLHSYKFGGCLLCAYGTQLQFPKGPTVHRREYQPPVSRSIAVTWMYQHAAFDEWFSATRNCNRLQKCR
jgi:hypothetical protein